MSGAITGCIMHDPSISFPKENIEKAKAILANKLTIYDKWQTPNWEDTRQLIREAALLGIKDVFLDPLTNFSVGMSGAERNDFLIRMSRELAEDAANYDFTGHVFCHYNTAPKGETGWNQGRVPTSDDFAGSRAMAQACNVMIGIQGWKLTDEEDESKYLNSRRILHVLEEREYNSVGKVDLRWDAGRGKLLQDNRGSE